MEFINIRFENDLDDVVEPDDFKEIEFDYFEESDRHSNSIDYTEYDEKEKVSCEPNQVYKKEELKYTCYGKKNRI